ncbi:hypothetical protein AB0M36_08075 [Actinoplanes sp. NPDC051346]|uniref:hypothetical protein n=1 Tax=Actinoplanes sp. NPDC051346 TaxID=3155048 RepID=UPI003414B6DC
MERKRSLTRAMRGGVVAAALTAGALVALPAAPAQAAGAASCSFGLNEYGCSSGTVTANSNHQIGISAMSTWPGNSITCRAHDANNGVQVGSVTSSTPWWRTSKHISGVYGSYFLVCTGSADSRGEGSISG